MTKANYVYAPNPLALASLKSAASTANKQLSKLMVKDYRIKKREKVVRSDANWITTVVLHTDAIRKVWTLNPSPLVKLAGSRLELHLIAKFLTSKQIQ